MIAPIPRGLLPETVEVSVPVDGRRGGEVSEPVEMVGVRIERARDHTVDEARSDGREATMWVDSANTSGAFEIPVGSVVEAGGRRWRAVSCERFEDFAGHVHHWEVGLR